MSTGYLDDVLVICIEHLDNTIKPEWVTTLRVALDGNLSADVAALFPSESAIRNAALLSEKEEAVDNAKVEASQVNFDKMLYVNGLRSQYAFNLLHAVTSGTDHCGSASVISELLQKSDHPFWTEVSAAEEQHVTPTRRVTFWCALWQSLNRLSVAKGAGRCVAAADATISGAALAEVTTDNTAYSAEATTAVVLDAGLLLCLCCFIMLYALCPLFF